MSILKVNKISQRSILQRCREKTVQVYKGSVDIVLPWILIYDVIDSGEVGAKNK